MPAADASVGVVGDEWWHWAAAGGFLTIVGVTIVIASQRGAKGPPPEGSLTPRGEGPVEIPPSDPALPPAGDKAKSYPQKAGPLAPPGEWKQLRSLPGIALTVRDPARAWGTPAMIDTIVGAAARFGHYVPQFALGDAQVRIADISRQGGGPLSPHLSHQIGNDVDVTIAGLEGKLPAVALPVLLRSFLEDENDNVQVIFLDWGRQAEVWNALEVNPELDPYGQVRRELQYPLGPHSGRTRIRHWTGHANHIHVRTKR